MWAPSEFEAYRRLYPSTPELALPDPEPTARFEAVWGWPDADLDDAVRAGLEGVSVVMVRGYLGNWMPGNLVGPARAFRALGVDARIASNAAGATVAENAAAVRRQLPEGPVLLCGHSKGGLEGLLAGHRPAEGLQITG